MDQGCFNWRRNCAVNCWWTQNIELVSTNESDCVINLPVSNWFFLSTGYEGLNLSFRHKSILNILKNINPILPWSCIFKRNPRTCGNFLFFLGINWNWTFNIWKLSCCLVLSLLLAVFLVLLLFRSFASSNHHT